MRALVFFLAIFVSCNLIAQHTDSCSTVPTTEQKGATQKTSCFEKGKLITVAYNDSSDNLVRSIIYYRETGNPEMEILMQPGGGQQITEYYSNGIVKEITLTDVHGKVLHVKDYDKNGNLANEYTPDTGKPKKSKKG